MACEYNCMRSCEFMILVAEIDLDDSGSSFPISI